jgi:hypothetical protein
MIHKQCLELVKVLFQEKENVSKIKFFTVSFIKQILFQILHPEYLYKSYMKDVMGINIVFTEGYGLKNIYPDAL